MPFPIPDIDSATAVPSTPVEKAPGRAAEVHFNASLDVALQILEKQNNKDDTTDAEPKLPSPRLATKSIGASQDLSLATPDDLITESTTCCSSRASSASLAEANERQKRQLEAAARDLGAKHAKETEVVTASCQVRARIPYPGGHFYLHAYHTNEDKKEHLAIVFGDDIRSASLEEPREGESDMDRRIRGASTGALRRLVGDDIANRRIHNTDSSDSDGEQVDDEYTRCFELDPAEVFAASRLSVVDAPLVRIHSECFTGETVSSVRCDCGYQLAEAMRLIQQEGRGVIVYLRQEGRGIGLLEKLKAYNLQDMGHDTVDANLLLNHPADARTYGSARAILEDLGISKMRLLTNNTDKIRQLRGGRNSNLDVVCHVPMYPRWWSNDADAAQLSYFRHLGLKRDVMSEADRYLQTKAKRMGHMLSFDESFSPTILAPRAPTSALYTQTNN
ncbi:GTP cyclohydrolase II [Coemansia guatemalensis]|uniref:GTP cyclohydrolase II n=1 Tax=Coemansia guatemalensis TaxID=2761395 RepID=A0A9W8HUH1_9FUNG|nr:GTP cyclohydrolase II [Coemansia guatemalensis]